MQDVYEECLLIISSIILGTSELHLNTTAFLRSIISVLYSFSVPGQSEISFSRNSGQRNQMVLVKNILHYFRWKLYLPGCLLTVHASNICHDSVPEVLRRDLPRNNLMSKNVFLAIGEQFSNQSRNKLME